MVGTGAPIQQIKDLKVSDIFIPQELTFKMRSDSKRYIVSRIPDEMQEEIAEMYVERDFDEPAFPSITGNGTVSIHEFQKRLQRTSIEQGFPAPGLSLATLSKTYAYRKMLETGDTERSLYYLGWRKNEKLFKHLGISRFTMNDIPDTKRRTFDDSVVINIIKNARDLMDHAYHDIVELKNVDKYNAPAVKNLCSGITALVNDYFRDYR